MDEKVNWNQLDGSLEDQEKAARDFCGLKKNQTWSDIIIPKDENNKKTKGSK